MLKTDRELGLFDTIIMGLSGAIGFEIFVLLDYAYFHLAGPSTISAILLAGLINLLIMFSYCELCAAIPEVGGEYTYVKVAYGGYVAFISGCFRWLASIFGAALAATAFSKQFAFLISIVASALYDVVVPQMPLIAMIVVVFFAGLNVRGTRKAGSIIVFAFLAIFAIFIVSGLLYNQSQLEILPEHSLLDVTGVFAATVYIFPMFFGMRALVAGASKIKDPAKNVPKGILVSAILVTIIYFSIAYIAAQVVPPEESGKPFINLAAERVMPGFGGVLFAVAGIVASLSALGTSLSVQSSIARGMSRDGYLPGVLLRIHQRFRTPYVAILAGSLFVILLSVTGASVEFLGYAASFGSLLVFALVNLSLMKLRSEKPHLERPFKTPLYPFTPIAGFTMSVVLLMSPILLRDPNATDALISGVASTAFVLVAYYLRMVGRYRLKIAAGGASLGLGVSLTALTYLIEVGYLSPIFPFIPSYVSFLVAAILILSGILNTTFSD